MNIQVKQVKRSVKVQVVRQNITVKRPISNIVVNQVGRRGLQGEVGPQGVQGPKGDPATNLVQSVNGKQGTVVLNASDVSADPAGSAAQVLNDARSYTDQEVGSIDTGVLSVVAGANVTVDNTDPKNPIVSSTGGGGVSEWGDIDGTLSDQTDLQNALNDKEDVSNKRTNLVSPNDTTYPTTKAMSDVINNVMSSALITFEALARKKTDLNTPNNTDYPTTQAVKDYVDANSGGGAVDSVNGKTGVVVLEKADVGLGNVDNTSDANKPISTATQNALDDKVGSDTSVSQVIALTQAEYDAIVTKDPTTLYFIKDL